MIPWAKILSTDLNDLEGGEELSQTITDSQKWSIESLLPTSTISPEEKKDIEQWMFCLTWDEAEKIIERLQETQLPKTVQFQNVSITDLDRCIKDAVDDMDK